MASKPISKSRKSSIKAKREISLPLEKTNFIIIGIGVAVLIIGYLLMSGNSVDGFTNTVIAPILLVLGYCIIIPYGILKKAKKTESPAHETEESASAAGHKVSSNIRTK
jgi:ABC-type lipoprotein release transport system permease subunit